MKKAILTVIAFAAIISFSYAHPPSSIDLFLRSGENALKVEISHSVNSLDHYIKKVTVKLNDAVVITQTLSSQPNRYFVTLDYIIPDAKRDDVITVIAECSKEGSLEKSITVD